MRILYPITKRSHLFIQCHRHRILFMLRFWVCLLCAAYCVAVDMGRYKTRSCTNPQQTRFDYRGLCDQQKKKWYLSSRGAARAKRHALSKIQQLQQQRREERQRPNRRNHKGRRKKLKHIKGLRRKPNPFTNTVLNQSTDAVDRSADSNVNDFDDAKISVDDDRVSMINDIVNVNRTQKGHEDLTAALDMINGQINGLRRHKELTQKHLVMYEKCSVLKMYLLQRMDSIPKMVIYDHIYKLYGYCRQTARRWIKQLFAGDSGGLTPVTLSKRGNHTKIPKGLQSLQQHYQFKKYVHGLIRKRKAWNTATVAQYVNNELLQAEVAERGHGYSNRTIRQWLVEAGFVWHRFSKSEYSDGHERPDVVEV